MIGRALGHYNIVEKLGEGGMGVVYKAWDSHLDRHVAVKILPRDAVADPGRRARFVQEAKAASALNHPNIIIVHDVAAQDGTDYIAMEFVSGQTMQEILHHKKLSAVEALGYAIQISDALARAHAAGIIHRDLKPANIMVSDAGAAKLLDFGLAKLNEPTPAQNETITETRKLTAEGAAIGTAAYMSPEQAEGKRIDARSDVFSFGLVLYEMLTGRQAFKAATTASTIAAILRDDPLPLHESAEGIPAELERIVLRCLRKDPARRFQHMDDVRVELQEVRDEIESGRIPAVSTRPPAPARRYSWLVAGLLLGLVSAALLFWGWQSRSSQAPVGRTVLTRLTSDSGLTTEPSLSPDGKLVAYASDRGGDGGLDIWVQQLAGGEPIRLTRDPAHDREPNFSPDGSRIVFRSDREGGGVYVVSALGGAEQKIAPPGFRPRFSPDGKWVAYWFGERFAGGGNSGVFVVAADGGVPRRISEHLQLAGFPVWSPDSRQILITGAAKYNSGQAEGLDWWIASVDSGQLIATNAFVLLSKQSLAPDPVTLGNQHLLPIADAWIDESILFSAFSGHTENVWRVPFSSSALHFGVPERLTSGTSLEADPSLVKAAGNTLVAFSSLLENVDLWSLPLAADESRIGGSLKRLTQGLGADVRPSLSPDGETLLYNTNPAGNWDIAYLNIRTGLTRTILSTSAEEENPRLSPNGSLVAYRVFEKGAQVAYVMPSGGGLKRRVAENCSTFPWASDGRRLLCTHTGAMYLVDVQTGESTLITKGRSSALTISFDDRWVSFYQQLPSGTTQIFVCPIKPGGAGENEWIPITAGEGWDALPAFSPDDNTIYFQSQRDGMRCLWAQRLEPATKRPVGAPFAVQHFHDARLSLLNVPPGQRALSIARDKAVFPMAERTGNIWLASISGN